MSGKSEYMRKWRLANREKIREHRREYARRWREANPEKAREHTREQVRRWREANPERWRENMRRWREANPEKPREYARKQRLTHPEKYQAELVRKRAMNRSAAHLALVAAAKAQRLLPNQQRLQRIQTMRAQGMKLKEIAKAVGRDITLISKLLKGMPRGKPAENQGKGPAPLPNTKPDQ
jgi:hypothetical protein